MWLSCIWLDMDGVSGISMCGAGWDDLWAVRRLSDIFGSIKII